MEEEIDRGGRERQGQWGGVESEGLGVNVRQGEERFAVFEKEAEC